MEIVKGKPRQSSKARGGLIKRRRRLAEGMEIVRGKSRQSPKARGGLVNRRRQNGFYSIAIQLEQLY